MGKRHAVLKEKTGSLRSKTFFSMVVLALTAILSVSVICFYWFRKQMIQEYRTLITVTMSNVDHVFRQYLDGAKNQVAEWFSSSNGVACRVDPSYDMVKDMNFVTSVRNTIANIPYAHSVYFLNQEDRVTFYLSNGVFYTEELDTVLPEKLNTLGDMNRPFLWAVKNRYSDQADVTFLSVYMREAASDSANYSGSAVFNLSAEKLSENLFTQSYAEDLKLFILDENGCVAAHSDMEHLGEDWSELGYMEGLEEGDTAIREVEVEGTLWEIYSMKSSQDGFYIMAQSEYINGIKTINDIAGQMIWMVVGAFGAVVIIALPVCRRLFKNFRTLISDIKKSQEWKIEGSGYDEIKLLDLYHKQMNDHIQTLRQNEEKDGIIKNILMGNQKENVQAQLIKNGMVVPSCRYYMVLAHIPDGEQDGMRRMQEMDREREMVQDLLNAELSNLGVCTCFEISLRKLLFVLSETGEKKITADSLRQSLEAIVETLSSKVPETTFLLVSRPAQSGEESCLPIYRELEERMKTKLIFWDKNVAMMERAPEKSDLEPWISSITEAVKNRKKERYLDVLEMFFEAERDKLYENLIHDFQRVAMEIWNIKERVTAHDKKREEQNTYFHEQLVSMRGIGEITLWFDSLYNEAVLQIQNVNSYAASDLMEDAVNYIRSNYGDKNLNVNLLADQLNITAPYFGKLFRAFAGCSAVEYIVQVRMERARDMLLMEPDKEIAQIAEAVGYSSNAYFATAFKKYFGVSPSKFRDYHAAEYTEEK